MPLRDHFRPPLGDLAPWDALHGAWPTMIVADLNRRLPPRYVASPRIHLGVGFGVNVAASDRRSTGALAAADDQSSGGGVATAVWAPPAPTLTLEAEIPEEDEYEVRIHDATNRKLVAAVEIVSPANKDRPESRRSFVAKCATLLRQGVSVSIVDVVTTRQFNLYADLLELLGRSDPSQATTRPAPTYAVATRRREAVQAWRLDAWAHDISVGQPLPTLPLWLAADLAAPLELESTYEETCRILRVA